MALTLEAAQFTKQRTVAETRKPKIQAMLKALFSYLAQHKGNPTLQFTAFSALATTSVVIADAACKVYAQYMKKPSTSTTSAFVKGTDHASAGSTNAPDIMVKMETSAEDLILFPDGKPMANGYTLLGCTTAAGATGSAAADQASGFVIVGAP